jgi:NAD(P)-dependent dehydrogenase (short-subunit alcohol dehydrogenase family)
MPHHRNRKRQLPLQEQLSKSRQTRKGEISKLDEPLTQKPSSSRVTSQWKSRVTSQRKSTGRRQKALDEAAKAKGKIDVLVANAGVGEFAPLANLTEEHFDKLFDLNVKGTLFTAQKALTLMNDRGSIILIGSVTAILARRGLRDKMAHDDLVCSPPVSP